MKVETEENRLMLATEEIRKVCHKYNMALVMSLAGKDRVASCIDIPKEWSKINATPEALLALLQANNVTINHIYLMLLKVSRGEGLEELSSNQKPQNIKPI